MSSTTSRILTALDRCDRCGAQAYIRADLINGQGALLFCAHHGREHMPKLKSVANIFDESDLLNPSVIG